MFRFLLFATTGFIFISAENNFLFCRQRGSLVEPFMLDVTLANLKEKCAPGFQPSVRGELSPTCYKYAPANSVSYETFTKQCKCVHGHPSPMKDKRVRFKRHFRGFRPQGFARQAPQFRQAPYQAKPLYGGFVNPDPQALRAVQQASAHHPVLDPGTYECSRYFDHCDNFPQPTDSKCPAGFIWYFRTNGCYKFYPPQTWHEAEKTCNSINAKLSQSRSTEEMYFLADFRRQIFPNIITRIQTHPLAIEEYDTWISKSDNSGGNCPFIKYRHDCTVDKFIQITVKDAPCGTQMPFACSPNPAATTSPTTIVPQTTTPAPTSKAGTARDLLLENATDASIPNPSFATIFGTTKKVRERCMV